MYVLCLYRPPTGDVLIFLNRLECLLLQLPLRSSILLAGDLNVNFLDGTSTNTQSLLALLYSFKLKMHVELPTRITVNSSTLLDYVCSNLDSTTIECNTVNAGLSDHEAVICNISIGPSGRKVKRRHGRLFSKKNFSKFSRKCLEVEWLSVMNSEAPLEGFHSLLLTVFDDSFPLTTLKCRHGESWFSKGLRASSRNMRSLHYIRKFFLENTQFITYFNNYRKIFRKTLRAAKKLYFEKRMYNSKNKQRETWKIVNDLNGKNSSMPTDSDLSCDRINEFYCSIADSLNSKITSNCDFNQYLYNISVAESFFLEPTDIYEIKDIFRDIHNKNASGWDGQSVKIFLRLPNNALMTLADCINHSFENGTFPLPLKLATVIPLYKGGDFNNPSNFRPISLLPTMSKIIEKLVKKRLLTFIRKHNLLCAEQYGF